MNRGIAIENGSKSSGQRIPQNHSCLAGNVPDMREEPTNLEDVAIRELSPALNPILVAISTVQPGMNAE